MPIPHLQDRVKDTTTTTGTGDITLSGSPPTGYQSFNAAFSTNSFFYYCIEGGAEWETGRGHLSASTTLVRDNVLTSSNSNAAVNFSAGTKNVFCTIPSKRTPSIISTLADVSRNLTSTLADDPTLKVPMQANKSYFMHWYVMLYVHSTPDFKYAFTEPTGGFFRAMRRSVGQNTTLTNDIIASSIGSTVITTSTANYGFIELIGPYSNGANAGNFTFQWAQNVSDANNVSVIIGSSVMYWEI